LLRELPKFLRPPAKPRKVFGKAWEFTFMPFEVGLKAFPSRFEAREFFGKPSEPTLSGFPFVPEGFQKQPEGFGFGPETLSPTFMALVSSVEAF
jgi:hypothetical protein